MIPYSFFRRFAPLALSVWLLGAFFLSSCSPKIIEKIVYETRDSIITKIDTLQVQLPPVYIKDYTALEDTLTLHSDYATAKAWVNVDKELLEGEMKSNEKPIPVPTPIHEEYHQKDSVQIQEVPVYIDKVKEVTPRWAKILLIVNIAVVVLGLIAFWIKRKI